MGKKPARHRGILGHIQINWLQIRRATAQTCSRVRNPHPHDWTVEEIVGNEDSGIGLKECLRSQPVCRRTETADMSSCAMIKDVQRESGQTEARYTNSKQYTNRLGAKSLLK